MPDITACVGCGSTDNEVTLWPYYWLAVNHQDGTGVCWACSRDLDRWKTLQAEKAERAAAAAAAVVTT